MCVFTYRLSSSINMLMTLTYIILKNTHSLIIKIMFILYCCILNMYVSHLYIFKHGNNDKFSIFIPCLAFSKRPRSSVYHSKFVFSSCTFSLMYICYIFRCGTGINFKLPIYITVYRMDFIVCYLALSNNFNTFKTIIIQFMYIFAYL